MPYTKEYKALIILMGFNYEENTYLLVLTALFTEESEEIYKRFNNILNNNY